LSVRTLVPLACVAACHISAHFLGQLRPEVGTCDSSVCLVYTEMSGYRSIMMVLEDMESDASHLGDAKSWDIDVLNEVDESIF